MNNNKVNNDSIKNKQFIATFMHPKDAKKFKEELDCMDIHTEICSSDRVRFWTPKLTPDILGIADSFQSVTVRKV